MSNKKSSCTFCGRTQDEVDLLISGIHGNICDRCVEQAYNMLEADGVFKQKQSASLEFDLKSPKEIKAALDEYVIGQEDAKRSFP